MFAMAPEERLAAPSSSADSRPWLFGRLTREQRQQQRIRGRLFGVPARLLVWRVLLPQAAAGITIWAAARLTNFNLTGPYEMACLAFWLLALPAMLLRMRVRRRMLHLALMCGFWGLLCTTSVWIELRFDRLGSGLPDPAAVRSRRPMPAEHMAQPVRKNAVEAKSDT